MQHVKNILSNKNYTSLSNDNISKRKRANIVILGNNGVGKTLLINNILSSLSEQYYEIKYFNEEPKECQIIDIKSNVSFYISELDSYNDEKSFESQLSTATLAILCFSLVDKYSLQSIKKWNNICYRVAPKLNIFIIGTQLDLKVKLEHIIKQKQEKQKDIKIYEKLLEPSNNDFFNILSISCEVLEQIFLYLSISDKYSCSLVCKRWNSIISDNYVWNGIIKGYPVSNREIKSIINEYNCKYNECSNISKKGIPSIIKNMFIISRKK